MAVGRWRRLGLGCLGGLSIYTGFLLGLGSGDERGYRSKSAPLVLLICWIGLICQLHCLGVSPALAIAITYSDSKGSKQTTDK